ncbi:MAG: hypothetical protein CL920_07345 [Deltaproteobacteria bacterium]|nr:hypothetical protein [Deltaproteobacteria bacterium]MBU48492.1 hypothetical protein [Deltaproteobacteria bacterium]|tara:strand:+ start:955 stop:1557 length:603 start_codon:yes stop_codon:yes gene_type:complete
MNHKQAEAKQIMRDMLGEDYVKLTLQSIQSTETPHAEEESNIVAKIQLSNQDNHILLEGSGVGTLDAFFLAMRNRLSEDYPSVKTIVFTSIKAQSIPNSDLEHPTDAEAEVSLRIRNSYGDDFEFVNRSRSLLRAGLLGLIEATEYFLNSELTYIKLYHTLEHYRTQGRSDLVDKYTSLLSMMVRNTSYAEVIERIKSNA